MPDEYDSPVEGAVEARGAVLKTPVMPRTFFMCQELLEQRRLTNSIALDSWDILPSGRDSAKS